MLMIRAHAMMEKRAIAPLLEMNFLRGFPAQNQKAVLIS
jgi:hypothetical protein